MTCGRVARWAAGVAALALLGSPARATEIRVRSGPLAVTTVTVDTAPDVEIEDRTPGAKPATGRTGPASAGETFTGELTIFVRGYPVARQAAIDVGDPVVSSVRVFPETGGATVTVFVRQPVTYSVSRPSATGQILMELRAKTRPLTVVGPVTPRGRVRVVRPKPTGEREVAVDAESLSYDQHTNTLTARGSVTLTQGDTTLTADEVVYDRTNAMVEARGHVVITDPQSTIEGDFAHLNLEDESGWVDDATADLHPSDYVVRAGRLQKLGGPQYSVANGVFTSCRCGGLERPSWSIGGAQTDVDIHGIGRVRSAVLHVKDVPVLWFPYFVFPANNDRQSGFLIPRVGYSNRRGFQYEQPFFWAISKSTDATFAVDVETAARIGGVGEYRYMLSRDAHGDFAAAYYNEAIRGRTLGTRQPTNNPTEIPENRFAFVGNHVSPFYWNSKFYLDLFAISDDLFLREINTFSSGIRSDLDLRTTRFTTSRTGVYKGWGDGLVNVETAYYQDLIDPQELALQKLPRADAEHSFPLLGDRVVGRVSGQAIDYQREQGYDGLRFDLAPDLFIPFNLGRALNGSVVGQLRETAYHLTDTEQVAVAVPSAANVPSQFKTVEQLPASVRPFFPPLDPNRTRELADVNARFGTEFARVFPFQHFGLEKVRHTFEPEVQYLWIPSVGSPAFGTTRPTCHTPLRAGEQPGVTCDVTYFAQSYLFDERDAVNRRNFLSYGFTSRLLTRGPTQTEAATRAAVAAQAVTEEPGPPSPAAAEFVGPPEPPSELPAAPKEKPAGAPFELARASVLHGYDVSRPLVGSSHQSDLDLGLRLNPLAWASLGTSTTVSPEEAKIRGFTATAVAREANWTPPSTVRNYQSATTAYVAYHFIANDVNISGLQTPQSAALSTTGVNELDGGFYLRLGDYLGLGFFSRFSYNDAPVIDKNGAVVFIPGTTVAQTVGPHFLERDYLVRLISRCNCWMVEAGVADKFNPDERLFRVQLTLVGLGSYGALPTRNFLGIAPITGIGVSQTGFGRSGPATGLGGLY